MLSNKQIQDITNTNLTIEYWEYQLGVSYVRFDLPEHISCFAFYPKIGKVFWEEIIIDIKKLLCSNGKPKPLVEEFISGEIRNIAQYLATVLVATYEITLSVAVPIISLIIKYGLINFCIGANMTSEGYNPQIIKKILENKLLDGKIGNPFEEFVEDE